MQIDGLSAAALTAARSQGAVPTLDHLIRSGHAVHEWSCGLPSDTLAVQTGLFWGAASPVPSFNWWDRRLQRRRRAASAVGVAAFERTLEANVKSGLLRGGACHGAAIGGGAYGGTLLPPTGKRSWFSMLRESLQATTSLATEAVRSLQHQSLATSSDSPTINVSACAPTTRLSRFSHAIARGVTGASRASASVIAAGVRRDMTAGLPVVFANFVEFDLLAHLTGPRSSASMAALRAIDHTVGVLTTAAHASAQPYRVVVLSDHGIATATPASSAFAPDPRTWVANEWARRSRSRSTPHLVVLASGTVLQAWVRGAPNRLDCQTLTAYAPGFVDAIARHPAIALTMLMDRSIDGVPTSYVLLSHQGGVRVAHTHTTSDGTRERPRFELREHWGVSPFEALRLRDGAQELLYAFAARHDVGDITCVARALASEVGCGLDGEFWSFEAQFGAHGGIGGSQARPFVLTLPDDSPSPDERASAASMHLWLERLAPPR